VADTAENSPVSDVNPNEYVSGRSESCQSEAAKLNRVENSTPSAGDTKNPPDRGALFTSTFTEKE
jgi:hypothetical protein